MHPLRLSLFALLFLAVLGMSGEADASTAINGELYAYPEWAYESDKQFDSSFIYSTFSPDGNFIAASSKDNHLYVFDRESSTPIWVKDIDAQTNTIAISENADIIVTSMGNVLQVYHKDSNTLVWDFIMQQDATVDISDNGQYIVAGSDRDVYFFESNNSEPIWTYDVGSAIESGSISMSSDGEYIAVGTNEHMVYLFGKNSSTPIWSAFLESDLGVHDNLIKDIAISTDGNYIIAGSANDKVYFFSKDNSTPLWEYITTSDVNKVDISSDGHVAVALEAKSNYGCAYYFDTQSDGQDPIKECLGGQQSGSDIAISEDGSYMVVAKQTLAHVYKMTSPLDHYYMDFRGSYVTTVSISPDSEYIIAGTDYSGSDDLEDYSNRVVLLRTAAPGIDLESQSHVIHALPGEIAYGWLTITNTGYGVANYNLSHEGYLWDEDEICLSDYNIELSKTELSLESNQSENITISVTIPEFNQYTYGHGDENPWQTGIYDSAGHVHSCNLFVELQIPFLLALDGFQADYLSHSFGFNIETDTILNWSLNYQNFTNSHIFDVEREEITLVEFLFENTGNGPQIFNFSIEGDLPGLSIISPSGGLARDRGYVSDYTFSIEPLGNEIPAGEYYVTVIGATCPQIMGQDNSKSLGCENAILHSLTFTAVVPTFIPIATINFQSGNMEYGQNVMITGSGTDIDGYISSYKWSSSIDGVISEADSMSTETLSYGYHDIVFEVTDDFNATNQTSITLYIFGRPQAIAGDDIEIEQGDSVQFSGAGTDGDGQIVKYEWDFDGDGVYEWTSQDTGITTFIYNKEGIYYANLRLTDNEGFMGNDTRIIAVGTELPVEATQGDEDGISPMLLAIGAIALIGAGGAAVYFMRDTTDYSSVKTAPVEEEKSDPLFTPKAELTSIECPSCGAKMKVPKLNEMQEVSCSECGLSGEIEI